MNASFNYILLHSRKKILSLTASFSSKQFEFQNLISPHNLIFYIGVKSRGLGTCSFHIFLEHLLYVRVLPGAGIIIPNL